MLTGRALAVIGTSLAVVSLLTGAALVAWLLTGFARGKHRGVFLP